MPLHLLLALGLLLAAAACSRSSSPDDAPAGDGPADSTAADQTRRSAHQRLLDGHPPGRASTEEEWDRATGRTDAPKVETGHERREDFKVFGWYPYSMGTAYEHFDFDILWGVSYFSYLLDPATGGYQLVHSWRTTPMIDLAQAAGTKVFLTVSSFGADANTRFLGSAAARQTLADSLVALLAARNAAGVNLDFEEVRGADRDAFTAFVTGLSRRLKAASPGYMVTLALVPEDRNEVYDVAALNAAVDLYTLMGYDYYGPWSPEAGPVAPLQSSATWGSESVAQSVQAYLDAGVAPSKLIVGLPWYGAEWVTRTDGISSPAVKFVAHPSAGGVEDKYVLGRHAAFQLDEASATAYHTFTDSTGAVRQLWIDNAQSSALKYDWIRAQGLAGVGIWALGFDQGREELWTVLAETFGRRTPPGN